MSIPVSRRLRLGVLTAALAIALGVPAAVSADTGQPPPTIFPAQSRGATVEVATRATITAKLIATVKADVICDPFEVFDWETGETVLQTEGRVEFAAADLLQVAGRTINFGSTEGSTVGEIVCDGETVTPFAFAVTPQNVPWKSGSAMVGIRVHIASTDFSTSDFVSSGAVEIKLSK